MNKLFTFVLGGAIGAIGALLLAPRTGEETRNLVADQAGNIANNAQELGAQAMTTIQDGLKQAQEKGTEVIDNVKDAASKGASAAADKNDELRDKIEAARERIAAQVKENVSQAAETVKDAVPEAADKAKDAVDKAAGKAEDVAEDAEKAAKKK